MTLRRKTRIIIGTMFLGLIVILYFLSESILLNGYRDIQEQETAIASLILMMVGVGLVFGIVTLFLLEKQVLSRLSHLSKNIHSIGTSGDISARVSMSGIDELSILASTINGMLAALQQSESELQESEEELQLMFESIADGVIVYDLDGNIVRVNEAAVQMHGYESRDELIGRSAFELIAEKDQARAMKNLKRTLDVGYTRNVEYMLLTRHGGKFDAELSAAVLQEASGKPKGFVVISKDITERKRADKKLQELYQNEKVLRQKLEEEINKRIEFTRALVHELKTPITPVLASSELLLQKLKDEPLLGLAQNISQGASNLNHRIDELLDLAKGEIGVLRLNPEPVDPLQLLQGIVHEETPVALRNGQFLNVELPSSLPTAWADEERFRQVVFNLMNNAFKFTPAGGKITLKAREEGANLIVEVQDTGYGISEQEQQLLFEPYRPLESDRERLSGLGLGLSLAKKLVELHGGQIWVKSQKGKGSTFSFSMPLEATSQKEKILK
ncbi:MAG: ATP-binding protein [Candidatus Bathyarchaeia archaeon]